MIAYADASFLASLYLTDEHSHNAVEMMADAAIQVLVSEFANTETINAIYQRCFRNQIRRSQADRVSNSFQSDIDTGVLVLREIPQSSYLRARTISSQWTPDFGTRTGDVIHLAACLELKCDALFSFDRRQRSLAEELSVKCLPHL